MLGVAKVFDGTRAIETMTGQRVTQILITSVAGIAIAAHLIWPALKIDAISLFLLLAAAIPWLLPLFKEIEFPGGWKFKFNELQQSERRAEQAGLLDEAAPEPAQDFEYSFQMVADEDPNLALAGLRIEIEKKLNQLADASGVSTQAGTRTKYSVGQLLRLLADRNVLTQQQQSVLKDMIASLNAAVHGASVDRQSAAWALEVGPRLLATLDKRRSSL